MHFSLQLGVGNGPAPPLFSADHLAFCEPFFAQQGRELFRGLKAKSSYLKAAPLDAPKPPLAISLAELGAAAGDTLRLERVGTYSDVTSLVDGSQTGVTGIFSSDATLLGAGTRFRVPGAVDAGADVQTSFLSCVLPLVCDLISTDVPQDFRIDPGVDVVVPPGAAYLILAPLPPSYFWQDDSGFGFGVDVTANPTPWRVAAVPTPQPSSRSLSNG